MDKEEIGTAMYAACNDTVHAFMEAPVGMAILVMAMEGIVRDLDTKTVEELHKKLPKVPEPLLEEWKEYAADFIPVIEALKMTLSLINAGVTEVDGTGQSVH